MALFLFLGPKPRGLNFAEIYARGGRGLQRPTFRDLIPPWGHSPVGPGRGGTAPSGAGRSPEHTGLCWGGGRGARRAWVAGAGAHAGLGQRCEWGGAQAHAGEAGRAAARTRLARKPGRVGARRGDWAVARAGAACGPNAAKSGRGPGARRRPSGGAVPGGGGGAGPGRRRWTLRHSKLSPAACVGSGAHPGGAGTSARRKSPFSLYKEARRSAGFSLSNQGCSG